MTKNKEKKIASFSTATSGAGAKESLITFTKHFYELIFQIRFTRTLFSTRRHFVRVLCRRFCSIIRFLIGTFIQCPRIACYGSLFNNYYYNRQQHCSTTWNLTLLKIRSILIDCVKQIQRKWKYRYFLVIGLSL